MAKQLVLVGGGHAHMVTLARLEEFVEKGYGVTVIGPSEYHYYSGMGPGMLGKFYTPEEIRFRTKQVVEKKGGKFVLGKVNRVDPDHRKVYLESGEAFSYDVVSFNAGSYVPQPGGEASSGSGAFDEIYSVKPIERLLAAQERLVELVSEKKITVGIVGGGPSSAEISGNIWRLARECGGTMPDIRIFAGKGFMDGFPEGVRRKVRKSLSRRGIEIVTDGYVTEITSGQVVTDSGKKHAVDFIFVAMGVTPSGIFKASGLPTGPDGGLLVNEYLQSTRYPEIFGGGDCIYFRKQPLDKVGVYAVRQNPVLFNNLMASLAGGALSPFDPGGDYLLIFNLGDGTGVLRKKWILFGGRPAFLIKDYIDRRFMKEFQAIE